MSNKKYSQEEMDKLVSDIEDGLEVSSVKISDGLYGFFIDEEFDAFRVLFNTQEDHIFVSMNINMEISNGIDIFLQIRDNIPNVVIGPVYFVLQDGTVKLEQEAYLAREAEFVNDIMGTSKEDENLISFSSPTPIRPAWEKLAQEEHVNFTKRKNIL